MPGAQSGHGGQQIAGVPLAGVVHDLFDRSRLHEAAAAHDVDAVGDQPGHAQIVGDHQDADAGALLELHQQVEDARLDGDVERGGGLVGHQQPGLGGQRDGDEDALQHAAGELVGVGAPAGLGG
ncbi:hypothetical protein SANTM175S_08360 [Streptomyces antimycoticus]